MRKLDHTKSDYILKKLPFINVVFIVGVKLLSYKLGDAVSAITILSIVSLSLLAMFYKTKVRFGTIKYSNKYLVFSLIISIALFLTLYFSTAALGWLS